FNTGIESRGNSGTCWIAVSVADIRKEFGTGSSQIFSGGGEQASGGGEGGGGGSDEFYVGDEVASDNFNRASLGGDWSIVTGSPAISSNELCRCGTSNWGTIFWDADEFMEDQY